MSKPRLLLADDSLTIRKLIDLTFADEGFDVVSVGDGDSALREMGAVQPDIALLDVHMPGPDGYEICKLMRSVEETSAIPVILLVGSFEPFDQGEADRSGANSVITKPFQSVRNVVGEVQRLLTESRPPEVAEVATDEVSSHVEEVVDTSDIDSLYEKSFAETVEMPAEMAASLYGSDRIDDEMIETSYGAQTNVENLAPLEQRGEGDDFDSLRFNEPAVEARISEESIDESFEPRYDDMPEISRLADADASSLASLQAAPTEEFRHETRDPFASTADDFDLDEFDILDLATSTPGEQVEFTTAKSASEQEQRVKVVTIAPELMEIIVQKVVEKLSEKY